MKQINNRLAYSTEEAARLLGVSRPTVYSLMRQQGFPSFKAGHRRLIPVEELKAWISNQMRSA